MSLFAATERSLAFRRTLQRAREGDKDALNSLLKAQRPYMRRVAAPVRMGSLAGAYDESDVVQMAQTRAAHKFLTFRGDTVEELRAWLATLVRRSVARLIRTHEGTRKRNGGRARPLTAADAIATDDDPCARLAADEERARFEAALALLSPRDRLVLRLRHFEDRTMAEIAVALGRSEAAARKVWARAVARLRALVEDRHEPRP